MTGILSIVRDFLGLFFPNSDIARQQEIYWSCIRIAFVVSALIAWWIQHQKANRFSKLDIEFKDIFLTYIRPLGEWNDDNAKTFLTVVFSITNPNSEANTIKSCRFILYKNQKFFIKTDKIEGEKRNAPYLKNGDDARRLGNLDTVIFQQGLPKDYAVSFGFDEDNNPFASDKDNLADKPFIVLLVYSYNGQYKYKGKTPKGLMKTLTRYNF